MEKENKTPFRDKLKKLLEHYKVGSNDLAGSIEQLEEKKRGLDKKINHIYEALSLAAVKEGLVDELINLEEQEEPTGKRKKASSFKVLQVKRLMRNRLREIPDWIASHLFFQEFQGQVSDATLYRIIRELREKGLIEVSSATGAKRLTHNTRIRWVRKSNSGKPEKEETKQ